MAQAKAAGAKRAKKVVEAEGMAHITATFNNTLITITVAANGVDFLEPWNPALPEDPQVRAFPCISVIVMSVLLNVAVMWAMPSASTTFLARFAPAAFACAIYFFRRGFFLPAIARRGPFLVRALVCVRWPRTGNPLRCREPRYVPMSINRLMFIATSVRSAPSTL